MNKVYSFLSLIARSRNLVSGGELVEKSLRQKKIFLVILAGDAKDNTKKRISDKCEYNKIKILIFGTKNFLGKYIGKEERAVIGITNINLAKKLFELIQEYNNQNGGEAIGKSQSV
ncbi:MAG: ribosomal L7Ae/L30e/S12e/Gadd45 family protein [Clostridiales bacterium]